MNLDALAETIETLKKRIDQHRRELSGNEIRTRASLINPILRALGWEVEDPKIVRLEYSIGNERADYALMKPDGKPAAVIEAKKLDAPFDDKHLAQMLNYAIRADIGYACLSDGSKWALYSVFERGSFEEKCRLNVEIAKTPAHECALKLLTLWRPNLASDQPVKAADPIFRHEPRTPEPKPEPPPTPTPEPPPKDGWVPLPDYLSAHLTPGVFKPMPLAIKFSDESEAPIHCWYDILVECAKWLHLNEHLSLANLPALSSSGRRYIVNSSPTTRSGRQMTNPIEIADGIYVSKHGVAALKVRSAAALFQHCGVDPSNAYLKTAG